MLARTPYIFSAGYPGHDFFDFDYVALSIRDCDSMRDAFVDMLLAAKRELGVDTVAFLEKSGGTVGPIVMATEISRATGLVPVIVKRRVPCMCNLCMTGVRMKKPFADGMGTGSRVALVEDVITTGDTVLEAAQVIAASGARAVTAISILDREMGAAEKLKKVGIQIVSVWKRLELVRLGFVPPTLEDLDTADFLKEMVDSVKMDISKSRDLSTRLEPWVRQLLSKKGWTDTPENRTAIRNVLIAFGNGLRVMAPDIVRVDTKP